MSGRGQQWSKCHGNASAFLVSVIFLALSVVPTVFGATMTAALDRDTVIVGESVTLTLAFEGGSPDALPAINAGPNLRVANQGSGQNVTVVNGQMQSTVTQSYRLTPLVPGVYQIPELRTTVQGQVVTSQPIRLTVLKAPDQAQGAQPLAFMKLIIADKQVYVGQPLTVELQVLIQDGVLNQEEILRAFDSYNGTPITAEGSRILRTAHANRRRMPSDGVIYNVATLVTVIAPAKAGKLVVESIKVPLTLQLPVPGQQRRRGVWDPFGMFQQTQPREMVLAAEPQSTEVLPLPTDNVPAEFNGAVGVFQLSATAGPTNVATGDPITVRIRIEGRGDLDGLILPEQSGWSGFKTYPPTGKVESTDPLGLQGAKIFEQVVVPQSEQSKELPGVRFSFFDPERRAYQTLVSPALPLIVRPGGQAPAPSIAMPRTAREEQAPPAPEIVPIKRKLGTDSGPQKPLMRSPAFLAAQLVPILCVLGAAAWRRRQDAFAANPRLRRRREVDRKVQAGLAELRRLAAENKSDEFFLGVFRLLQEQIGERLDVPASSITEAVVDERLRPRGVSEDVGVSVQRLFQLCDQARYAPVRSSQQLEALVPEVETVLKKVRELP